MTGILYTVYFRLEETVHSLMPYRNQAEVLDTRLSQLIQDAHVSILHSPSTIATTDTVGPNTLTLHQ